MIHYNVFLDSNIFIKAKYNFKSGALGVLNKYCNDGTVTLFTNDIIVREVKSHIDSDVGALAKHAKNEIKKHGELIYAISMAEYKNIEEKILSAPRNLHTEFDTYMSAATNITIDNLSMAELFDNYFGNVPPFENREKKKSEFPDAVAIMSIKRSMNENTYKPLCVITDDSGWHDAFSDIDGVIMYKDLKTLLTEISKAKEEELFEELAQYMGWCLPELNSSLNNWVSDQSWDFIVDNIDSCIECDEIIDVYCSKVSLVPDGIEYIDKENDCAVSTFSGVAEIKLEFLYSDHTYEFYDREDHTWYNTVYGNGTAKLNIPFSGTVSVLGLEEGEFQFDSPDFDEIDRNLVELLTCELNADRVDDAPYFDFCPDCGVPIGIHNDGGSGFCVNCAPNH